MAAGCAFEGLAAPAPKSGRTKPANREFLIDGYYNNFPVAQV